MSGEKQQQVISPLLLCGTLIAVASVGIYFHNDKILEQSVVKIQPYLNSIFVKDEVAEPVAPAASDAPAAPVEDPVVEPALVEVEVIEPPPAAPVVEEAVPVVEEAVPVVEEAVPEVEEAVPVVEEAVPVVEEAVPVVEEAVPVVEEVVPVVEEVVPVVEEVVPVVEEAAPVVEEAAPVVEETAPEVEEAPEVDGVESLDIASWEDFTEDVFGTEDIPAPLDEVVEEAVAEAVVETPSEAASEVIYEEPSAAAEVEEPMVVAEPVVAEEAVAEEAVAEEAVAVDETLA